MFFNLLSTLDHLLSTLDIQDVRHWISQDKFFMNDSFDRRQTGLAKITFDDIFVEQSVIAPQSPVRNLGVWLDSNLSVGDHITKTSSAYSILLSVQYQEDKEIS